MVNQIFRETKTGKAKAYSNLGEQPWNLQTSRHPEKELHSDDNRPRLHAIILDFTGVPHIDITGLQNLVDVRHQLDKYADWKVNWHFVGLSNPWIKRALISAGFGSSEHERTVFSLAHVNNDVDSEGDNENNVRPEDYQARDRSSSINTMVVPILDIDRPFFHADLDEAYDAAMLSLSQRQTLSNSTTFAP
jgi:sodium-independent sulfate anion transporter 11